MLGPRRIPYAIHHCGLRRLIVLLGLSQLKVSCYILSAQQYEQDAEYMEARHSQSAGSLFFHPPTTFSAVILTAT